MRPSATHLEESSEATPRLLDAHRATTRALCAATSLDAGLFSVLQALAISLNYRLGEIWTGSTSAEVLVCQFLWPLPKDPVEFEVLRHELALRPGEERPGRVWSRGQAEIACDTSVTPTFAFHARPGAPSQVLCFPLAHQGRIHGVVQLFADHAPTWEGQLLLTASVLGEQIGQFVYRMGASETVRESGIRKAGAVESALDCIVTVDHEGHIKDVNSAATTTFGYPRGDVLGRPLLDLVVPSSKAASPGLAAFLSDGPASLIGKRVETRALRADGSSFPIELALTRIAQRGPPLFAVTVRDITERRQNEDQLRRSREQLAIILQGVSEGITAQDSAGRIVFANDAAAKLLGRATAQELLDLRVADLDQDLCLVDDTGVPFFLGQLPGELSTKNHLETALRVSTARDPSEIWSAIQASPVADPTGRLQLAIVIWRDITETLRAERAQRFLVAVQSALAESLDHLATLAAVARLSVACMADSCAIDLLGKDGAIQRLEAGGIDLHTKAHSSENEHGPLLGDSLPEPLCDPIRVIRTGQPELVVRDPSLRKNSLLRSCLSVPLRYQDRTLGALTWGSTRPGRSYGQADLDLAMDIARRAAIAVEHARLFAQATEAVRLRDDFLCVASHELKTPLTTLKLQVQALQRKDRQAHRSEPTSAAQGSGLTEIGSQVEYLTSLIDSLLDVSRLTAGQLLFRLEDVDLSAVVKDIVARSRDDLRSQECTLSVRIAGPIVGHWDRLRLEQVVTNLLSNAMKYGMGKPIEVGVDADEGTAKLTVRDFGIGIAKENQARIFQRYERAVPSTMYGGLGLGLWIVRQIVDALEGSVQVSSQPDKGSTFTVTLPRQRGAAP